MHMARVGRDILAIPGVSIAFESLFSSLKHTLSDASVIHDRGGGVRRYYYQGIVEVGAFIVLTSLPINVRIGSAR
jgi:hypothetical protein